MISQATCNRIHIEAFLAQCQLIVKLQASKTRLIVPKLPRVIRGVPTETAAIARRHRLRSNFDRQTLTHSLSSVGLTANDGWLEEILGEVVRFLGHLEQLDFILLFSCLHTDGYVGWLHHTWNERGFSVLHKLLPQLVVQRTGDQAGFFCQNLRWFACCVVGWGCRGGLLLNLMRGLLLIGVCIGGQVMKGVCLASGVENACWVLLWSHLEARGLILVVIVEGRGCISGCQCVPFCVDDTLIAFLSH